MSRNFTVMAQLRVSWASTEQQQGQLQQTLPHHLQHPKPASSERNLHHCDSAGTSTSALTRQPSWIQSASSFSGESMSDIITGLLNRGVPESARSPPAARSPSGSRVSSRRESFMFFMGMSTDSALSDSAHQEETPPTPGPQFRSSFKKKYCDKSTKHPATLQHSLNDEYNNLLIEHKKYKRIIDVVQGEYEEAKNYEFFRRYTKLKGVIKRCVMYTKLGTLPDVTCAISMGGVMMVGAGINRYQRNGSLDIPKEEFPARIHLLKRRISLIRTQIETLAQNYETSKRYMVFARYRLMKAMIKELLSNCYN